MRKRVTTALSVGLLAMGMMAATPRAASAQTVWVFNQMDVPLKPCYRVNKGPWVDFGGIAPHGQFAWSDFIQAAYFMGADPSSSEALVRFTWVAIGPGVTCPDVDHEPNAKTVFTVDGNAQTPIYLMVGGREEVRHLEASKQVPPGEEE